MAKLSEDERRASGEAGAPQATERAWVQAPGRAGAGPQRAAVLLVDATGEVVHASPSARALIGSRASDLVGRRLVDLVTGPDRPAVAAWIGEGRPGDEVTFGIERRPGLLGTVVASARHPRGAHEPVVVHLVEARDGVEADDPHLAVQQLRTEVRDLARRNAELLEFAFTAAHDLRAPLMAISAAAQGLVRVAGAALDEESQALVGQVLHGVGQMRGTIDALLRSSGAGEGLRFTQVDVDELVAEVLARLRPRLDEAGAEVVVEPLRCVVADRDQLASVLSNLLENALQHRAAGRPPRIEVTATDEPGQRVFSVADNGRGIPEADRDRVFRMFERHDRNVGGTGIGLAVCQRNVE
ncbi:MAG: ATP-binding protein, partial [Acidimicrobiia bacterium]